MTYVWVVYTRFTDDPSSIKGIFTNYEDARACYNNWDDKYKDIQQMILNQVYTPPVVLE